MKLQKLGGFASLGLALQFMVYLALLGQAGGVTFSQTSSLILHSTLASFAVTLVLVAFALRKRWSDVPQLTLALVIIASIASALFLVSGILSIAGTSPGKVTDLWPVRSSAMGLTLLLAGLIGVAKKKLSIALSLVLILAGVMQVLELAQLVFIILNPLFGIVWSLWLAAVFFGTGGAGKPEPA